MMNMDKSRAVSKTMIGLGWEPLCEDEYMGQVDDGTYKTFEMVQVMWLDTTSEESDEYILLYDKIYLDDFSDEEKKLYLSLYGHSLDENSDDDWLIAECILRETISQDRNIIGDFETHEAALDGLLKFVDEL